MESLNVKNINDEKIFNVIDPNGQGEVVNRIRPISISINQKAQTINDQTDSTINLAVYWNDTWKSILDLTFDESLRQEYGKLTQDLTNIQKDIDMKQYKDAETKTADFLKYVANLSSKYTAIPEKEVVSKIKNDFVKIKADKNSVKVAISDKLLNFMLKKYAKVNNLDYTKSNECFSTSKFNCLANNYDIYYHSPEIFQKQAYMTVVKDNKVVGSYKVNYDQFSKFASKFMLTPQKLGYSKDRLAGYMKIAEVVMQNIFFDSVDEAKEWQEMVDEKKKEQATTPEGEEETTETTTTETKTEMGEGKSESPVKGDGGLARPSEDFASDEIPESEPRQQEQQGGGQNLGASRRVNLLKKRALKKKATILFNINKDKEFKENGQTITVTLDKINDSNDIYFYIMVEYDSPKDAEKLDFSDYGSISTNDNDKTWEDYDSIESYLKDAKTYYENNFSKSYDKYVKDTIRENISIENGKPILKKVSNVTKILKKKANTLEENKKVLKELEDLHNNKDFYYAQSTIEKLISEIKQEILVMENGNTKKAKVGYNAEPENMEEEVAIELADELMSAANVALEKAGLLWGGYSGEEQRRQRVDVQKNAIEPLLKGRLKESIQGKVIDLIKEHLTDLNYHTLVSAIEEVMGRKQARKKVKLNKKAENRKNYNVVIGFDGKEEESDFAQEDVISALQEALIYFGEKWHELPSSLDNIDKLDFVKIREIEKGETVKEYTKEDILKMKEDFPKYSCNKKALYGDVQEQDIVPAKTETKVYLQSSDKDLDKVWGIKMFVDNMDNKDGMDVVEFTKIGLIDHINELIEEHDSEHDYGNEKLDYNCSDDLLKEYVTNYLNGTVEFIKESKINSNVQKKAEEQTIEEKIEEAETSDIVKGKIGVGDIVTVCIDKLEYPEEAFKYTELIGEPLILMENDKEDINKVIVEQTEYPFQRMTVNKDDICQYAEIKGTDVIVEDTDGDEMITTFEELPVVAKQCKIKSIHKAANITKKKANLKAINSLEDVAGLIDDILSDYDWYDYADQLEVGEKSHYENILADLQKDEKGTIEALFNRVSEDDEEYSSPKLEELKTYYNAKFGGK